MREIKSKAEASEVMVQEICRDIKKLDHAKKHITATITALNRLAMLGTIPSMPACSLVGKFGNVSGYEQEDGSKRID